MLRRAVVGLIVTCVCFLTCLGVGMKFEQDPTYTIGLLYLVVLGLGNMTVFELMYAWGYMNGKMLECNWDFLVRKKDKSSHWYIGNTGYDV